jgi:glycine/D-amino acid oxidase-like deaminating enzyme/nitrite reductase/ring-hydroxylating ferredoxin subunit
MHFHRVLTMTVLLPAATRSIWSATTDIATPPPLRGSTTADVCIIGAGISGLTTAYLLGRRGKKVLVIDDGRVGGGETRVTTAHLASAIDDRFTEIERLHGAEGAHLAAASHAAAIDQIEQTVRDELIDCSFERLNGYLFGASAEDDVALEREFAAARRAGAEVELLNHAPLEMFDVGRCLRFANQAQFHPLRYLCRLIRAIVRDGGRIYGFTHAVAIDGGRPAIVEIDGGFTITANAVVVATNTPFNDRVAIHTKQSPYTSYVIGCQVPVGEVPRALYWDMLDSYHYVRLQSDAAPGQRAESELLIVGGEDHKTGQATDGEERFERLERWARERFPIASEPPRFRWSGQVMETIDGLAFIGRNPLDKDNVYVATGDSGMGMTHGTIAGMLLTELICGNDHPWRALYDPSRKTLGAAETFVRENLNVAAEYGAWLTGGDVRSEDEIAPGTGAIVRRGLHKVAVYRDNEGHFTRLSATCPHLNGVVAWNAVEHSWDCPCHGSRFQVDGQVIHGPANTGLRPWNGEVEDASEPLSDRDEDR